MGWAFVIKKIAGHLLYPLSAVVPSFGRRYDPAMEEADQAAWPLACHGCLCADRAAEYRPCSWLDVASIGVATSAVDSAGGGGLQVRRGAGWRTQDGFASRRDLKVEPCDLGTTG